MLLDFFPDHTKPDFNIDGPCPKWGWPNMVIHATGREVEYPEHNGPLSIKCAFGGREIYKTGDARFAVDDASYLILNNKRRYASSIRSSTAVETFCVFFQAGFVEETLRSVITPTDQLLDDPHRPPDAPITFFEKLYPHDQTLTPALLDLRAHTRRRLIEQSYFEEQLHRILERLLQVQRNVYRDAEKLPAVRQSTRVELYYRLSRARDFIDASFTQSLNLAQVAAVACLSPHHFLRTFKHVFHETPHQYLIRKRLASAQELLRTTDAPVTDICFAVGFESLGSFSWLFRRRLGVSPEAYRMQEQRRVA